MTILYYLKVCDLQTKWKKSTSENEEFIAQLQVYKETQEELTSELSDFKEKYCEIVDLLHDSQNELKAIKKDSYSCQKFSEVFDNNSSTTQKTKNEACLKSEIYSSIYGKKESKSQDILSNATTDISTGWKNF